MLLIIANVILAFMPARQCMAINLDEHPAVGEFIEMMVEKHNFSTEELENLFRKAEISENVVQGMDTPREAVPWYVYRKQFVTPFGAIRGASYWKKNDKVVAEAVEKFGVAPEIIMAIIGIESQYGYNPGRYRIMDALSTLAFSYPRRGEAFRGELEQFLILARELKIDPLETKSSYAGAVGLPQFLPSSYRKYAIDFDKDGRVDLFESAADAIGSIGNFFKIHGWQKEAPVVDRVLFTRPIEPWLLKLDIKPRLTIANLGYYSIKPEKYNQPDRKAALIKLDGEDGKFLRLGFNNFYVITRYNKSVNYAMAVFELGEMIKTRYLKNQDTQ